MTKVLFIEDNPSWQDILLELLKTAGHEAKHATSFDTALGLLNQKHDFDVLVFDLHLGKKGRGDNPFVWLDALKDGLEARNCRIPPIIIVTGLPVTPQDVRLSFVAYRGLVFDFFEKTDFNSQDFMKSIKQAVDFSKTSQMKETSLSRLLVYTLLMIAVIVVVTATLLVSINQLPDLKTRQLFLQIVGGLIIILVVCIIILIQNTKIQDMIESLTKIWRG